MHPVCCSNGFTHCGSTYPTHSTRLSWPSPFPSFCSIWVLRFVPPDEPQPASTAISAVMITTPKTVGACLPPSISLTEVPPFPYGHRLAPPARGASPPQLLARVARAPRPTTSHS